MSLNDARHAEVGSSTGAVRVEIDPDTTNHSGDAMPEFTNSPPEDDARSADAVKGMEDWPGWESADVRVVEDTETGYIGDGGLVWREDDEIDDTPLATTNRSDWPHVRLASAKVTIKRLFGR